MEMVDSVDGFKSSRSIKGTQGPDFEFTAEEELIIISRGLKCRLGLSLLYDDGEPLSSRHGKDTHAMFVRKDGNGRSGC